MEESANVGASSHYDALANELIPETIRHATEARFYADLYKDAGVDVNAINDVDSLSLVPIVDKERLREAGQSAVCDGRLAGLSHIQHTSGTTAEPFFVHRSMAEVEFIQEFFTRLNAREVAKGGLAPIMLQTQFPDHGMSTPIPAHVFVVPFSITDERLIDYALLMLARKFDLPRIESRVSILSGSHTGILALTNYALEQGIDCRSDFEIRLVHLEGRYLTRRWRSVLRDVWGAAVSDKYSLAEIFGGANSCSGCAGFHFDPLVVPEVVDRRTGQRIENGTGVLLLTSLYPFVQLQPMIRYWTGDLFEIDRSACHLPRFEYRGRVKHALFDCYNPDTLLLTGVDIVEALDGAPEANRTIRFRDLERVQYQQAVGELKVKGVVRRMRDAMDVRLMVELAFQPGLYRAREGALREELLGKLLSRSSNLADAVASERVTFDIRFVRPGTMGSLERFGELWTQV